MPKKIKAFDAEHDLRVTLECAGNNGLVLLLKMTSPY